MEKDDVQLIHSILSGDESAFSALVQKYQKSVHALAWRKVQDFQLAEEITQDAFLQAYRKLATLKNPSQFAGWLYVITNRLCNDWFRREKMTMQSLETTSEVALEKAAYSHYISEQREESAAEHRREIVKKLLDKLPESERTVVTLYYLGEMTTEAISKFLGVSVNTIKSRLRRARQRLKKEEPMIRETLGSVQLPANLTDNIMRRVTDIKPAPSSGGKPLIPWAALGSAVIFVILLMGASNQYLSRFQKPYSLTAQSEPTIEIVDLPIVLNIEAKPDLLHQVGHVVPVPKDSSNGLQISEAALNSHKSEDPSKISVLTPQWTRASGPQGGQVHEIFATSKGDLFTISSTGIYRMTADATGWMLINDSVPIDEYAERIPMAEREGILYVVSSDEIFASTDAGLTWNSVGIRPNGTAIGLIITDEAFYLAMKDKVYRSTDSGKQWHPFNNGLTDREITAMVAIGNTVFVSTDRGVYRLNSDMWEQLPIGIFRTVDALAAADKTLYVGLIPADLQLTGPEARKKFVREMMRGENSKTWELFRSTDLGNSWLKITPPKKGFLEGIRDDIKIVVAGKTVLALGSSAYRSKDAGLTWENLGLLVELRPTSRTHGVAVNENMFYVRGLNGLHRSTDGGESWELFMKGVVGTNIQNLIPFNNRLYTHTLLEILQSTDNGETWSPVLFTSTSGKDHLFLEPHLTVAGNTLYGIFRNLGGSAHLFRLTDNGDALVPVEAIPAIGKATVYEELTADREAAGTPNVLEKLEEIDRLEEDIRYFRTLLNITEVGRMAIDGETFYVAHNNRLIKWKPGYPMWIDTGLDIGDVGFVKSLTARADTVYLGKAGGTLLRSFDAGKSWKDITTTLPLQFEHFGDIVFEGSTVYVATEKGVLTSQGRQQWRVLADSTGTSYPH